jgi:hypothetical protein
MDRLRRRQFSASLLALLAWTALGLQFGLMLRGVVAGQALLPAIGKFFFYFTILTNLQAAIVLTRAGLLRTENTAGFETATAVYIAMVGLGYSLLLRHLFHWTGWMRVADELLHDAMPVLFVLWWIFLARKRLLPWRVLPRFLVWPLIYLVLALLAGAITGWYPYPFVNAQILGYPKVLTLAAGLLVVTAALSAAAIAFARRRSRNADER